VTAIQMHIESEAGWWQQAVACQRKAMSQSVSLYSAKWGGYQVSMWLIYLLPA